MLSSSSEAPLKAGAEGGVGVVWGEGVAHVKVRGGTMARIATIVPSTSIFAAKPRLPYFRACNMLLGLPYFRACSIMLRMP